MAGTEEVKTSRKYFMRNLTLIVNLILEGWIVDLAYRSCLKHLTLKKKSFICGVLDVNL